jgi:hypothetical protein
MLFRKPKTKTLDTPAAAEQLRREIANAVAKAQAHGVGSGAIVTALTQVLESHRYCETVNSRSSFHTSSEIVHIGR